MTGMCLLGLPSLYQKTQTDMHMKPPYYTVGSSITSLQVLYQLQLQTVVKCMRPADVMSWEYQDEPRLCHSGTTSLSYIVYLPFAYT